VTWRGTNASAARNPLAKTGVRGGSQWRVQRPGSIDKRAASGLNWAALKAAHNQRKIEESGMKRWKRPVIVEIQVGMEINLYVCAEL